MNEQVRPKVKVIEVLETFVDERLILYKDHILFEDHYIRINSYEIVQYQIEKKTMQYSRITREFIYYRSIMVLPPLIEWNSVHSPWFRFHHLMSLKHFLWKNIANYWSINDEQVCSNSLEYLMQNSKNQKIRINQDIKKFLYFSNSGI